MNDKEKWEFQRRLWQQNEDQQIREKLEYRDPMSPFQRFLMYLGVAALLCFIYELAKELPRFFGVQ